MFKKFATAAAVVGSTILGGQAVAQDNVDPTRAPFYEAFAGKTVAFVPIAMSLNIHQAWAAGIKDALEPLGVNFVIRDGNFNVDASAQAITNLIDEGVDVIIVQNNDVQAFARLFKLAQSKGIYVIQLGMASVVQTEGFIGPDWTELGERMASAAVSACGKDSGKSGKIALIQGAVTSANGIYTTQGIEATLKDYPEIEIVANQGSDWDPSKAHAIATTTLQQHPDLCAFLGYWEDEDQGIVAALSEAGKADDVTLITSGIGEQKSCGQVRDGSFDLYLKYDSRTMVQQVVDTVSLLLQGRPEAGTIKALQITPLIDVTKETVNDRTCWRYDEFIGDSLK